MQSLVVFAAVLFAAAARPQFGAYRPLGVTTRPYYQPRPTPVVPAPLLAASPTYRPAGPQILILKQTQDLSPEGSYAYSYDTENGISVQEVGTLANVGAKEPAIVADGSYRYTSPEGIPIEVRYVANENGFVAQGAHLPTPPPIPEAILRSLEFNARNAPLQQQPQYGRK
ncbi:endocuticle structural glycoprotein SgAbd-2-like [Bacillus rossius redtenbacheri]|uniref:endocuticle structural glycoprotein SgAbd-2-like n=1 Tax=Bacillus rossius redtenbacheri TaxID=93214 RepID=UPI002FDD04B2